MIYRVRFAMRAAGTDVSLGIISELYASTEIDAKKAATRALRASGLAEHTWIIHIDRNDGASTRCTREKGLWIAE